MARSPKIEKLVLSNFQKHRKLTIRFGQVVTIVGNSDAGKSAIIRALYWLATNKPRGTAYIRHGAKSCSVSATVSGRTIKRKRSASKNIYVVDGKVFKSFGTFPPVPVSDALQIHEINFQRQHDPVFWLSLTPSAAGQELNQIVNLELIDKVLNNLVQRSRKLQAELRVEEKHIEALEHTESELAFIPGLSREFSRLQRVENKLQQQAAQIARLDTLIQEWQGYYAENVGLGAVLSGFRGLHGLSKKVVRANQQQSSLKILIQQHESIPVLPKAIFKAAKNLPPAPDDAPVNKLRMLIHDYELRAQQAEQQAGQIAKLKKQVKMCPKCGRPL